MARPKLLCHCEDLATETIKGHVTLVHSTESEGTDGVATSPTALSSLMDDIIAAANTASDSTGSIINDIVIALNEKIEKITPTPGSVKPFATNTTPSGWLLCDGAAISRTTYSALFSAIGTTYGSGDGSTTFNIPNLTDRFIQGSATAGTVKEAGLPNIEGWFQFTTGNTNGYWDKLANQSGGAFQSQNNGNAVTARLSSVSKSDAGTVDSAIYFDASLSSVVYGNSDTVQPSAVTMRFCIKY